MIAAVLNLHIGARAAFHPVDEMQSRFLHRHDVVDDDLFLGGEAERGSIEIGTRICPGRRAELFQIAEHAIDFRHGREALRLRLRRAAGHHDARLRPLAADFADGLARLAHRFAGDGASIDHDSIGKTGRLGLAADDFRLVAR